MPLSVHPLALLWVRGYEKTCSMPFTTKYCAKKKTMSAFSIGFPLPSIVFITKLRSTQHPQIGGAWTTLNRSPVAIDSVHIYYYCCCARTDEVMAQVEGRGLGVSMKPSSWKALSLLHRESFPGFESAVHVLQPTPHSNKVYLLSVSSAYRNVGVFTQLQSDF